MLRALALADQDARTVVAAVHTGGRDDQVTDTGQTRKGVDVAAHGHAQPGDLGDAAGDKGRAGVVAVAKAGGDANTQRNHILQRAAQLHALDVGVGVHAHAGVAEHILHELCRLLIRAGRDDSGRQVQRHFLGVGGAGEGHQLHVLRAIFFAQLVRDDFRHGVEGLRLHALCHVHDDLPVRDVRPCLRRGGAHEHRRHCKQQHILAGAHFLDTLGELQLGRDLHARQVGVHPGGGKAVHLGRQRRPHLHLIAADRQHPCQSHAPGACTQNADFMFHFVGPPLAPRGRLSPQAVDLRRHRAKARGAFVMSIVHESPCAVNRLPHCTKLTPAFPIFCGLLAFYPNCLHSLQIHVIVFW